MLGRYLAVLTLLGGLSATSTGLAQVDQRRDVPGANGTPATGALNLIRPGQEGRFPVAKVATVTGVARPIGSIAGYDVAEINSPVDVSGMGKSMAVDRKGYVWYVETREDKEVRVDPRTLEMTTYQLPAGAAPYAIAIDGNDTHWITAHGIEMLIESRPEEGYCLSHQPLSRGFMIHIAIDRTDNTVYVSQPGNNRVVCYHPDRGFKEFVVPTPQSGPARLDVDRHRNLWLTELYANKVAKLDVRTGTWQEWDLPTPNALPAYCRAEDDGGVWISEPAVDKIAYLKDGKFREYQIPTKGSIVSSNIRDAQNRLWFTEGGWRGSAGGNKVGVLIPETGEIHELALPTRNAQPLGLVRDRQDNIWFQQCTAGKICRAAPAVSTARN